MELTKNERLILANQMKILEKLCPDEADYYRQQREAIESGYKLHYDWLFENFSDEMEIEECREILDILEMYRAITFSFYKLDDKSGIDEEDVKFRGFDGNEEINEYAYTRYFIVELKRYDELRYGLEYPDLNSHIPMMSKYRMMLEKWNKKNRPIELTKDVIKEILGL